MGNPLLRVISAPVHSPEEAGAAFDDLRAALHEFQRTHGFGRGISATQIGEPKRLIYIELDGGAWRLEASGPFLELLRHEMDHLDGVLATDRAIDRDSLRTREEHDRQVGAVALAPHAI